MRLYEFDDESSYVTKIVALSNQLKNDLDNGDIPLDFSVENLQDYFRKYDVILDRDDLYNMISKPPLKDVIRNIQGDKVVFKGQDAPGEAPQDQNQKVVAQMAKNALKK
jgi:hypothetical protein